MTFRFHILNNNNDNSANKAAVASKKRIELLPVIAIGHLVYSRDMLTTPPPLLLYMYLRGKENVYFDIRV